MSFIINISTAVPNYELSQMEVYKFMKSLYNFNETEERKHEMLYQRSGINKRHSCIPDYDINNNNLELFSQNVQVDIAPSLEKRMALYHKNSTNLALKAIESLFQDCEDYTKKDITHLITVSCTGMSAPGLDLQLLEALELTKNTNRTSVNFMGCYAAIHGLKQAHAICESQENANVLLICVELCTLHFQKNTVYDNLTANAIFADGAAAALICSKPVSKPRMELKNFYSEVCLDGKNDMAWELSSKGFLMTLSSYIPSLLGSNINELMNNALAKYKLNKDSVANWAIHPGGRKILEVLSQQLELKEKDLECSYAVLKNYGNMSSPTILFVLKEMLQQGNKKGNTIGAAFGPGLTMETFLIDII